MPEIIALYAREYEPGMLAAIEGVSAYRDQHQLDWDIRLVNQDGLRLMPQDVYWLIPASTELADIPMRHGHRPAVSLTGSHTADCSCGSEFDEPVFGQLAARHLYERGYRNLATVTATLRPRTRARLQGFTSTAKDLGLTVTTLHCGGLDTHGLDQALLRELRALPGPVGIYCFIDDQAMWLREQFLDAGLQIPEDVALIGTGDHHRACHARMPFLSSVSFPWKLIGFEAGRMLHHQIAGTSRVQPNVLRPVQVVARASTHAVMPCDPIVTEAIAWLAKNFAEPNALARMSVALGRSHGGLGKHFRQDIDVSPKKVLDRIRIDHACRLLSDTDLSIASIASFCGFTGSTPFGVCFRRLRDCTPGEYRSSRLVSHLSV